MHASVNDLQDPMIEWRHDFHQHPELGFAEHRTAARIAELLRGFGLEVHEGVGATGVVGVLKRGGSARSIGLRADMDALAINEENTFSHRSTHAGRMHACGHDGHTAMLLGAAKSLAEDADFDGTVVFIFQPAEEHGRGALSMLDDGLFDRFPVDAVYGMHNMPSLATGHFAICPGPIMACEDNFEIVICGKGGHAALPHLTIDPIVVGAEIVTALQNIVSRSINPVASGVLSITDFSVDSTRNVIPETIVLRGDTRSFTTELQQHIEAAMERIVSGICAAHGATYEFDYTHEFAVTVNSAREAGIAAKIARECVGNDKVDTACKPIMASEDFGFMLQQKAGCYVLLGNGGDGPGGCGLHSAHYDFNDEILATGAQFWTLLVRSHLAAQARYYSPMNLSPFDHAVTTHHQNARAAFGEAFPDRLQSILGDADCALARKVIEGWNGYHVTPLHSLDGFARELGVANLYYKDEASRFGLGSFKALGGAYAVLRLLSEEIPKLVGKPISDAEISSGKYADAARQLTVVTATDGNHGRSVAWGARQFGCACKIYMHAGVSSQREQAVADLGAEVIRVSGNYDASVHQAQAGAARNDWFVVSDTSYPGYEDLPQQVMAGYTVMTSEIIEQVQHRTPLTHVFVQGGVGGLAGAVCGQLWREFGKERPHFVVVEPERADCLFQSALQGHPTTVDICEETIMAGLSCGEVSLLAWKILDAGCDDFMTITDDLIAPVMRLLARNVDDPAIVAGESAVAGLAGLIAACRARVLTKALGLNQDSNVLVIGTEGATDPEIYASIIGRPIEEVAPPDVTD